MNATALPTEQMMVADMAQSLVTGVKHGVVDLGDGRSIEEHLRVGYFTKSDIAYLVEAAVDRARATLQALGSAAATAAEAGALILLLGAWVFAYVAICPGA